MIPADLLSALREKDPELWERLQCFMIYEDKEDEIECSINIASYGEGPGFDAILQYCLQERIRARGWGYAIGRSSKGMTSASVYVPGGEGETVMGYDDAEALCRAYLAALGWQRR